MLHKCTRLFIETAHGKNNHYGIMLPKKTNILNRITEGKILQTILFNKKLETW